MQSSRQCANSRDAEARASSGGPALRSKYLVFGGNTGIGLNTPADVHYGLATGKAVERAATLAAARARHPERFSTGCDPQILAAPDTAWINKPAAQEGEPKLAA